MTKKQVFIWTIKAVCFSAIFAALFWNAQVLLHPKHHSQYTMDDFYRLPENSVDVLFCGSSHMVFGMDANIFAEMTGLNAYSIAINGQHLDYTCEYLEEALKTQTPRIVVVDTYHFIRDTQEMQIVDLHYSVDSLRWSLDKLRGIAEHVPREYWSELLLSLIRYHSRWAELTREDMGYLLNDGNQGRGNRGFAGLESVLPVDVGGWSTAECRPLSDEAEELLEKFLGLSEENGFEIVFLNFPVTGLREGDYARYNTLYQFCDEHGIRYVDYNMTHYRGFDEKTDFADYGHLNVVGAKKISIDFSERYY